MHAKRRARDSRPPVFATSCQTMDCSQTLWGVTVYTSPVVARCCPLLLVMENLNRDNSGTNRSRRSQPTSPKNLPSRAAVDHRRSRFSRGQLSRSQTPDASRRLATAILPAVSRQMTCGPELGPKSKPSPLSFMRDYPGKAHRRSVRFTHGILPDFSSPLATKSGPCSRRLSGSGSSFRWTTCFSIRRPRATAAAGQG